MTGVAIIDDHAVLADCLALVLREQGIDDVRVISPADGDPLDVFGDNWPDLCLLDLDLGSAGKEGLALIPKLAAHKVTTVIFTGNEEPSTFGRCLEAGAVGVIAKTTPFVGVVEKIRTALDGGDINTQAELYSWLMAATRAKADRENLVRPFHRLTQREAEVLAALVSGMHADEIAAEHSVSERTVRTQIRAIFQKLNVHSQLAAVALVHKSGWRFERARDGEGGDARSQS